MNTDAAALIPNVVLIVVCIVFAGIIFGDLFHGGK